jgi:hypothetical protein
MLLPAQRKHSPTSAREAAKAGVGAKKSRTNLLPKAQWPLVDGSRGWRGDAGKGIRPNSTRVEETKLIHQSIWRSKTVTLLLTITVRTDGESVLALEPVAQFPVSAAYFTTATRVAPTLATLIPSYPPPRPIRVLCYVKTSINVAALEIATRGGGTSRDG